MDDQYVDIWALPDPNAFVPWTFDEFIALYTRFDEFGTAFYPCQDWVWRNHEGSVWNPDPEWAQGRPSAASLAGNQASYLTREQSNWHAWKWDFQWLMIRVAPAALG